MPGVTAVIRKELLQDRAFNISREKVEHVREVLRTSTADAMNSLGWSNKKMLVLKPLEQVTPVIMLAGDITLGDVAEIATPDVAAIVHVWAFDYPSRNGVMSMIELNRFTLEEQQRIRDLGLFRFMPERLRLIQSRMKVVLGTEKHIEVNFVPQREDHWLGG